MPTRDEAEERLKELAQGLADVMGWGNKETENGSYAEIYGSDMERLGLRIESSDLGKMTIRGIFPTHDPENRRQVWSVPHGERWPKISVSLWSKTPEQISNDIARRLWPDYSRLLNLALDSKVKHQQHERMTGDLAKRLAAIVGGKVDDRNGTITVDLYHSRALPEFLGTLEVSSDSVRLERFWLTPEEAEAVLFAIVKVRKSQ